MSDSHNSLILNTLKNCTPERLQKAVTGLADGSYAVTTTRLEDGEIRAFVKNGGDSEYGVTITAAATLCSCKDSMYRGLTCKHAVAVALHVLRTPPPAQEIPVIVLPAVHLMWSNGEVLCGLQSPPKVWLYPWPAAIGDTGQWPDICARCVTERTHPGLQLVQTSPHWTPAEGRGV
jgi:hypothetical protein